MVIVTSLARLKRRGLLNYNQVEDMQKMKLALIRRRFSYAAAEFRPCITAWIQDKHGCNCIAVP